MSAGPTPYDAIDVVPAFELTSTDLVEGGTLGEAQVSGLMGAGGSSMHGHTLARATLTATYEVPAAD